MNFRRIQFRNTKDNFGFAAKFFHWSVAILVLLLLNAGFYMADLVMSPFKLNIYMLHKSFGILVLVLVVGRVVWRFAGPRPDPLPSYKPWEGKLAKIVHLGLYACLFLMPLSGWLMSSAGGFPATFFGLFPLPSLIEKNKAVFAITREVHEIVAYAFLVLLALHFAGAFKHHFIDRDATLKRMTSYKAGLWWGILLAAVAGLLWTKALVLSLGEEDEEEPVAAAVVADTGTQEESKAQTGTGWAIDSANSTITFAATQYGEAFQGEFKNFGGKIIFDPARLDNAYADIWIDITSITTGSADRDGQAKSADWFDTEHYPKAQFVADSFSKIGPNRYMARGALTVRGHAAVAELPFTLQIRESPNGQTALMQADLTLNRLDFGIGQGQWQDPNTIGNDVKVSITVVADAQ